MARLTDRFKQPGNVCTLVAPYALTPGDGCLVGSLFGVSTGTFAISTAAEIYVGQGVFTLPKVSADVLTQGQLLYWNDTTKQVTSTASTNKIIGCAMVAAGNGVLTVDVRCNGSIVN